MSRLVVDASVVAKLYFPETLSDRAESVLLARTRGRVRRPTLLAPDLLYAELANVVWKRRRRGDIDMEEARSVIDEALALPIVAFPSVELSARALELAMETDRSVYDCLYLAVAIAERATLVTADERFANALQDGPFAGRVRWIGQD
ncbi:MAG: PIN domain-containing protein [Phycisphaeraceae bacterium]|nr:MAG: PIN domain-containing protein [Phycisphaeraceae bacterium]